MEICRADEEFGEELSEFDFFPSPFVFSSFLPFYPPIVRCGVGEADCGLNRNANIDSGPRSAITGVSAPDGSRTAGEEYSRVSCEEG